MELILNELSMEQKFTGLDDFFEKFREVLKIYNLVLEENLLILKPSNLYSIPLYDETNLNEIITNRQYSRKDEVRKYKSILSKIVYQDPFWDISPLHKSTDRYLTKYTSKENGFGLAESYEREQRVLSFSTFEFGSIDSIKISKNSIEEVEIKNFISLEDVCEQLYREGFIEIETYCKKRFKGTNLSFDRLEKTYGFDILNATQKELYIKKFVEFSRMSWQQIITSEGLNYKEYSPGKKSWFIGEEYYSKQIMKFRINQKYRCFGYREGDIFMVLRFEIDHSISDNG
ncbi:MULTISPECIES: hypothetical protein [Bacillus cereus group]|uniref:hypothetical protein n=1 Tax=Bacillus cereus group TaxID=86661 RepID=UPI003D05B85C